MLAFVINVTPSHFCPKNPGLRGGQHHFFLAVFLDCLKALAVGAPLLPGLRIVSPLPALMRFRLALMLASNLSS